MEDRVFLKVEMYEEKLPTPPRGKGKREQRQESERLARHQGTKSIQSGWSALSQSKALDAGPQGLELRMRAKAQLGSRMKICCRTTSGFCSVLALQTVYPPAKTMPHSECSPEKLRGAATFSLSMRSRAPNPAALICFPQSRGA